MNLLHKKSKLGIRFYYFPHSKAGDDIDDGLDFENFKKCLNKCWDDFEDKAKNSDNYNEQLVKDFENCVTSGCKAD